MRALSRLVLVLALVSGIFFACSRDNTKKASSATNASLVNGYSLLYSLVQDESKVDGILKIKNVSKPTKKLILEIAKLSRRAVSEMNAFEKWKPELAYDADNLPLVETATRKSIAYDTTIDLLTSSKTFEVKILLTQISAAGYGKHLADELREIDPNKKRRQWLKAFAEDCVRIHDGMVDRLAVK